MSILQGQERKRLLAVLKDIGGQNAQAGTYLDSLLSNLGPVNNVAPFLNSAEEREAQLVACGAIRSLALIRSQQDAMRKAGLLTALVKLAKGAAVDAADLHIACWQAMGACAALNTTNAELFQTAGVGNVAKGIASRKDASPACREAAQTFQQSLVRHFCNHVNFKQCSLIGTWRDAACSNGIARAPPPEIPCDDCSAKLVPLILFVCYTSIAVRHFGRCSPPTVPIASGNPP